MKKILIISFGEHTGLSIKNQLHSIFNENLYIDNLNSSDDFDNNLDYDLLIFSSEEIKNIFQPKINKSKDYVVLKRVIRHECIDEILKIERGKEVLLVNDTEESCKEVIDQLKNQGVDHIKYYPYYPGIKEYKNLNIAITPGETHLVPREIKNIIDINSRKMDITSLIEVLNKLEFIDTYSDIVSSCFYRDMINMSKKYINISQETTRLKDLLTNLLDNQKNGIIYTNDENEVLVLNEEALRLLNIEKKDILSKNIYSVFKELKEDIVNIDNKEILVVKEKIKNNNTHSGNMIILNEVNHIHQIDDELRKKKKSKENQAKYTFEDMIGNCSSVRRNIKLAKKVAKSNSTVLIQGETGTGKEVLAQAIHNESERKDYPFVAINFAAIPENLIESELFGYEDGAFTGAKKGGKIGLFKKAHKGTIFLDEIGDAPLYLQSRLLRVLQEREITPVGSTETIPIDIRIIAATNKELLEEVRLKNFREDLYYRLNVMPMYSIPLRERKEDIRLLLEHYLFKVNKCCDLEEFFTNDSIDLLENYEWPGNIRELVNIVEYVSTIKEDGRRIDIADLPRYIIEKNKDLNKNIEVEKLKESLDEKEFWVLEKIYKYQGIGRRTLSLMSMEEGLNIGEGKMRTIMSKLNNNGYIEINRGLKGTKILEKGINILNNGMKKG